MNPKIQRTLKVVARSSILWGCLVSVVFFTAIQTGPLASPFLIRYTAGHPVEYAETIFFFIGAAILVFKALEVRSQRRGLDLPTLGPIPLAGQTIDDCEELAQRLVQLPPAAHRNLLTRRLHAALEYVWRCRSAQGLNDELKYLGEQGQAQEYASYAFLRVIIWAIPILGFLGTVVGITMAIANLSPQALEKSLEEVTFGLGVAFDTTALALSLAMLLMFGQYLTERAENALLEEVDRRATVELVGRFDVLPSGAEGQTAAVQRMAEQTLATVERAVERQAEIWRGALEGAQQQWNATAEASGKRLETALAGAVAEGWKTHAATLASLEQAYNDRQAERAGQFQQAVTTAAEALAALQQELRQQTAVLTSTVEATGEVARLEEALNRNLEALAGTQNFEQTVMTLAATIQLLNARLAAVDGPKVHLPKRTNQAA